MNQASNVKKGGFLNLLRLRVSNAPKENTGVTPNAEKEDDGTSDIEVDFKSVSPEEIRNRLLRDGCCLLRGAIPPARLKDYETLLELTYRKIATRLKNGETISEFERVHVTDSKFMAEHGPENSYVKLLSPKFFDFMDAIFGKGHYQKAEAETLSRSIHWEQIDPTSFKPLQPHIDGVYHDTWPYFAINFWVPFRRCGRDTDYPGLFVFPANFKESREQLGMRTVEELGARKAKGNGSIPSEEIEAELQPLFSRKNIKQVSPTFELGDVMLINSWTLHGTFWAPYMKSHRRNLELRFQGDSWNPVEAEKPATS